jgi:hypothetical protein
MATLEEIEDALHAGFPVRVQHVHKHGFGVAVEAEGVSVLVAWESGLRAWLDAEHVRLAPD